MFFIIFLIAIGVPLLISFLVFKIVQNFYPKRAFTVGLIVFITPYILIAIILFIEDDISEGFYQEEFKIITAMEFPTSARIEFEKEDYPYFKGEHIFSASIKINEDDFKKLLLQVKKSPKLIKRSNANSDPYRWIKDQTGNQEYIYYASSTIENDYHFIGFCEDRKTIIIHLIEW